MHVRGLDRAEDEGIAWIKRRWWEISKIFAQSLNLAQSGLLRIDLGMFFMDPNNIGTATVLLLLGCSFWYVLCYSLTLLVLNARVNTLYQQGVLQLKRFLEAERVEIQLIDSVQEHFKYVWQRTISSLNTLLQGGEEIERQLATVAKQIHFSPGSEIVREMDLAPSSRVAPILLKSLSVVMVLHAMTCGWMMIACRA
ncbi:unnamed protein product, partial [Iphiclides podalirius]